ncbi:hypothetical protein NDU88_008915 [Pleurodeles waltl]|uniref:Uncharacterized protein n=1 Tax=Pleurodeles waltl TaxID=8319 RepID=A0AAV7PUH1_PLEWA|nr:hypothetical protein NDU88_008915 [Pleurodeles waltl]
MQVFYDGICSQGPGTWSTDCSALAWKGLVMSLASDVTGQHIQVSLWGRNEVGEMPGCVEGISPLLQCAFGLLLGRRPGAINKEGRGWVRQLRTETRSDTKTRADGLNTACTHSAAP